MKIKRIVSGASGNQARSTMSLAIIDCVNVITNCDVPYSAHRGSDMMRRGGDELICWADACSPEDVDLLLALNPYVTILWMYSSTLFGSQLLNGHGTCHIEENLLSWYALKGYVPGCVLLMYDIKLATKDQVLIVLCYRAIVVIAYDL